ncbi:RICIN domain-containing protein [Oribacterium sinus]
MRRRQKQILAFFVSLAMVGSATIPAYAEQENIASETIVKETTETKSEEAISEDSVGSLEKKEGEAEGKEVQVPEEKKQVSEGKVQEEKGKEEAENKENSRKGVENEVKEKEVAEGSVAKEENTYSIVDLSKLKSGFKETEEEGIEEAPVAETASLFGYSGFRSVGYVPRTTNPGTGGRFYGYDNPFPEPGWNCTWYAFGRAYEILGYKPNFYGNARDWWGNNQRTKTFPTGSEPRPGAIACWWGNSVYIYGHVAVVEKVENGVVYTSSSSYGTAGKGSRWSYSFRYDRMENVPGFQGYIYLYNQPTPPPKPDHLPLPVNGSDDDIADGDYLITSLLSEGRCLAYGGNGQSGQNVFLRDYYTWGDTPYYWHLERQSEDDSFIIRSKGGTILDVNGGPGAAGNGPNIQVWNETGTNANQRFYIVKSDDGNGYQLIPKCSGFRVDVDNAGITDGTNVRQYEPNGSYAQRFNLVKYNKPKVNEKSASEVKSAGYVLRSKLSPDKAVVIEKGNPTKLGINVLLWDYNKTAPDATAVWNLEKQADGSFLVKNQYNNQYLDVVADGLSDRVNILTWEKHGKPSELWYVVANGDGTYRFVNKGSGKVVDITGGLTADGTNVQQYLWHGHDAQRFYLDRYPAAVYYNVTFKGMNGENLSTQRVEKGENASYPSAPLVQGYEFTGWDKDARNVQGNITITAQYKKKAQTGGNSGSSSSGSSGSTSGGSSGGGSSSGSSKPSGGGSGFSGGGSSFSGSSSGGGGGGGSSSGGFGKPSVSGGNVGQVLGVERSLAGGQWMQDGTGWWYKEADGSYPKNNWGNEDYNGKTYWYYFLDSGYMATGWIELNGSKYYLFPTSDGWKGRMVTGWQWIDGYCYYLEEGGANQGRLYRNEQKDGYQLDSEGRWTVNGKPVKR